MACKLVRLCRSCGQLKMDETPSSSYCMVCGGASWALLPRFQPNERETRIVIRAIHRLPLDRQIKLLVLAEELRHATKEQ